MNRLSSTVLAGTAVGLLALSVVLFFVNRESSSPAVDASLFAVEETEHVDEVQLIRKTDTVILSFDGSRWKVNRRWDADAQMITVLMATLKQEVPHRPVSKALVDSVNAGLNRSGTRVVVRASGETLMDFVAGGNAARSEAWFRKSGQELPYIMIIPGYRVFVSGIFELQASGWRNKRIFDFNWRNFKTLSATYPQSPREDFVVEMKQKYFGISGMEADTTRLNDYLDAVSLLVARRFVDSTEIGLPVTEKPVARIEIRDIANRRYSLDVYAPVGNKPETFGRLSDGQWVALDRRDVPSLVRLRTFFAAGR